MFDHIFCDLSLNLLIIYSKQGARMPHSYFFLFYETLYVFR